MKYIVKEEVSHKNKHVREDGSSGLPSAEGFKATALFCLSVYREIWICLILIGIFLVPVTFCNNFIALAKVKCNKTSINTVLGVPVEHAGNKVFRDYMFGS